jgi:pullulanase/glycogen debranching enzyme
MLATLLFSHGTPMLLGGDEFGRTQHGNNNAYAQDNELSWFDWAQALSPAGSEQRAFVARLIQLRREFCSCAATITSTGGSSRCRRYATSSGSTKAATSCAPRTGSTPKGGC